MENFAAGRYFAGADDDRGQVAGAKDSGSFKFQVFSFQSNKRLVGSLPPSVARLLRPSSEAGTAEGGEDGRPTFCDLCAFLRQK